MAEILNNTIVNKNDVVECILDIQDVIPVFL